MQLMVLFSTMPWYQNYSVFFQYLPLLHLSSEFLSWLLPILIIKLYVRSIARWQFFVFHHSLKKVATKSIGFSTSCHETAFNPEVMIPYTFRIICRHKAVIAEDIEFKVMPKAWKQNKDDFITNVSARLYAAGELDSEDKFYSEKLADAFNRHAWRAAYFISSLLNIEQTDYRTWEKRFFKTFYDNGASLKGYSEKVMACHSIKQNQYEKLLRYFMAPEIWSYW